MMSSHSEPIEDDSGDCIKVYVRVRPAVDTNVCLRVASPTEIHIASKTNPRDFTFDHVADQDTTQDAVFEHVGKRIVESCVEGYNGTIFAYGQTGSGKTYTMLGPGEECGANFHQNMQGIIPRSLDYLFQKLEIKKDMHGKQFEFICKVSFLEIYNEYIYDLLDTTSVEPLHLREGKSCGVFVEGAIERNVSCGIEAYDILSEGWCNRRVASTSMNRESSRSHAVFTVKVELIEHVTLAGITKTRQSVLNLVDLAGSERQRDTQATGIQLREAGKINSSLSVLGQVIMALDNVAHKRQRHVPYRNSKLTFLLRDSLGGNAKTFIIVNVHPNSRYYGETLSTLQFAQRAKQIKNRARVNENTRGDIMQLQAEIKRLKNTIIGLGPTRSLSIECGDARLGDNEDYFGYREKFFTAMQMRRRQDRLIKSLRIQVSKMEKYNMSRDLIIKLRNSNIASLRSGIEVPPDQLRSALEEEIEALKLQIAHHPKLAIYGTKMVEMQNEIDRWKSSKMKVLVSEEKELEELHAQLLEKLQCRKDSVLLSVGDTSSLPSPLLDAENEGKMAEMEETLAARNLENDKLRETVSSLQSDLKLSKNQVVELESVIQVMNDGFTMERKRINSIHESTLRIISTPKRLRDLRNEGQSSSPQKRAKHSPLPICDLDCLLDDEDIENVSLLMDEPMPDVAEDVLQEALQEELKKAKEDVEHFRDESLNKNEEIIELRKCNAQLMEKVVSLEQVKQLLSKTQERYHLLEEECVKHKTTVQCSSIEVRDLRILLSSSDKELKEMKEKSQSTQVALNKRITTLEDKCHQLEKGCLDATQEKERLLQEAQTLQEEMEILRLELDYAKEQLGDSGETLDAERNKNENLQKQLEDTRERLECEKGSSAMLREQLMGESRIMSEELAAAQALNFDLEQSLAMSQEECKNAKQEIEKLRSEITIINGRKKDDEAYKQALINQVTELRGKTSMLEIAHLGLHADLDDVAEKLASSSAELEKEREERKKAGEKLLMETEEFSRKEAKHQFDMDIIQDDLIYWNEQNVMLSAAIKEKEDVIKKQDQKLDSLQGELNEKLDKLKEQDVLMKRAEQAEVHIKEKFELEKSLKRLHEQSDSADKNFQEMRVTYIATRIRANALESQLQECKSEIIFTEEKRKRELEELHQTIEKKCKDSYKEQLDELTADLEMTNARERQATSDKSRLELQLQQIRQEINVLKSKERQMDEETERLKDLVNKKFTKVNELTSKLKEQTTLKSQAEEQLEKLLDEKENLMTDVTKLAGHHNHNQRIQYMVKLKDKCSHFQEECDRKTLEIKKLASVLKKCKPDYHHDPSVFTTPTS